MELRNTFIDIAKGCGILLIVLGHNYVIAPNNGKLWNALFSFHIPLFFFLSGLFINPNYEIKKYTIKRIDSYLKPYFSTLILLGTIIIPLESINPFKFFGKILYGTGPLFPIGWVQLWFLPHLFLVSFFSYLFWVNFNIMSKSIVFRTFFLLSIFATGLIGLDYFWNIEVPGMDITLPGLPFSIDLIFLSSFYFLFGAVFRQHVLAFKFNWNRFIFTAIIFALIHFNFDYTIDFNMRRYDNLIICTITSLVGIYLVLSISRVLLNVPLLSKILAYIGSASLFILIFHNFIQLKTINVLKLSLSGNKYIIIPIISFLSFSMAILVPLLLYEFAKRIAIIKKIFLPVASNNAIN